MEKCICLSLCSLSFHYYQCTDQYWEIVLVSLITDFKETPQFFRISQTPSQISSVFLKMNIQISATLEDQL